MIITIVIQYLFKSVKWLLTQSQHIINIFDLFKVSIIINIFDLFKVSRITNFVYCYRRYYYYGIEEAHGEAVRFFSPRCHIIPKLAHVPWKTVEWPSHLCEIWSHCLSTTSHAQFRWLGMVKGWCIAPA